MTRNQFDWEHHRGRDTEGELFDSLVMVHGSGRILARIALPLADQYYYRVYFYVPKAVMESCDDAHDFISEDTAIEFAEAVAADWPDEVNSIAKKADQRSLQPKEA